MKKQLPQNAKQRQQRSKQKFGKLRFLAVLMLLLVLTACGNDGKPVSSSFGIEGLSTEESGDHLEVDLSIPMLSGFDSAEAINGEIAESVAKARGEIEQAAAELAKDRSQMKAGLHSNYLYSKNGEIASLWIMFDNYTGGAHGLYWIEPYTFNTATSERYNFSDLFQEGKASAAVITGEILDKISKNSDLYFESAEETVKNYEDEFPFYINGNQITVFFPLYDIAPYAAGIQYFDFNAETLKNLLKSEIYEAIRDASPIDTGGTISEH